MASPKVRGVPQLLNRLNKFGLDGRRLATAITNQTADNITNKAKVRCPVDLGQLRQSIGHTTARVAYNRSLVFATAPYAAYQNFGTGGFVNVPKGFEELAALYKGKGIRKVNVPATGFLTTPYIQESVEYPKRLQVGFDKLSKDFNRK